MRKANFLTSVDIAGLLYCLAGIAGAIYAGFMNDGYLSEVRNIPYEHQTYPYGLIIMLGIFILVHTVILLVMAKLFHKYPWLSFLVAIVVTLGFLFMVLLGAMHSPPAWSIFGIWEFALFAIVLVTGIAGIFKKLMG